MKEHRKLINEGFVFTDQVFSLEDAENFSEGIYSTVLYATADLMEPECITTETAASHIGIAYGLVQMLLAIPNTISEGGYLGLPSELFKQPLNSALNCAEKEDVVEVVVEEEDIVNIEEDELLNLGEALEDELEEIATPLPGATTENIGYIETMEGFDVRLPKESIEQITRTIAMTPHEGFKPVVRVNMLGQIVLDFEPL